MRLVQAIQSATDLRLVLPFGLSIQLGDVISVGRDGNFTLEGTSQSQLGMDPGIGREPSPPGDFWELCSDGSTCAFRTAGKASSLFPDLPTASAGFDVHFESAAGWLLAATGRQLLSLDEVNRFRQPILDAHQRKVWKPDWALVIEVATAQRVTLVAARTANTNVALSLGATVAPSAGMEVKLTAGVSVTQTSEQVTQWVRSEPAVLACRALRVRDHWWRSPQVGTLAERAVLTDVDGATDDEFWEDADDLGPN
jgi:hypothetical protein